MTPTNEFAEQLAQVVERYLKSNHPKRGLASMLNAAASYVSYSLQFMEDEQHAFFIKQAAKQFEQAIKDAHEAVKGPMSEL